MLTYVEHDVLDPKLQQIRHNGTRSRRGVTTPPIVRVGEDVAYRRHAVARADEVSARGSDKPVICPDPVEDTALDLRGAEGIASAEAVELLELVSLC